MKKLIILPAVLALCAGAGFAEVSWGGYFGGYAQALSANTGSGGLQASGKHFARLQAKAQNEEGTFGALVRVNSNDVWYGTSAFAWGWWKPVEQLRLQIGRNPDGDFATNFIAGWGFHANDAEDLVAMHGYGNMARSKVFYAGFDVSGAELTVKPVPALAINVAVPYELNSTAAEIYTKTHGQITYDVGMGEIAVTFTGGKQDYTPSGTTASVDTSSIYAQFYLKKLMEEKLQINIAAKYSLPAKGDKFTYNSPVAAGFGVSYDTKALFSVKARLGTTFVGSLKDEGVPNDTKTYDEGFKLGFDVMPMFELGVVKLFVNAGIEFTGESEVAAFTGLPAKSDAVFGWYVNPYVSKKVGMGTFFAGAQLSSNIETKDGALVAKDKICWAIPIGITIEF